MGSELTVTVHSSGLLSLNQRLHWAPKAKRTEALRLAGKALARSARIPRMDRARVMAEITWPDRRRRDAHNLAPTWKALIDGCVDAGVLPDDSDEFLVGPWPVVSREVTGRPGFTRIRLMFEALPPLIEGTKP